MKYKVQSTERTTGLGADQETRALLYLLNDRDDSKQMHWFVVDFFNDVTGVNGLCNYSIDVQAKASKNIGAKKLGEYSVTLYKNYCSCLSFNSYVLFVGGVGARVRNDNSRTIFGFDDMTLTAQKSFISGLNEAATNSTYIDDGCIDDDEISSFAKLITIVISSEPKQDIIKRIANLNNEKINDEKLISIFNEIRDKQSVLKNNNVEGIEISTFQDFLPYKKYLVAGNVSNLILHRLIDYDFSRPLPNEFSEIVNRFEYDLRGDIEKKCKDDIMRVLFDKNNAKNFWALFSIIRQKLNENINLSLDDIYAAIDLNIIESVPALDIMSTKFFISLIKESLKNDN